LRDFVLDIHEKIENDFASCCYDLLFNSNFSGSSFFLHSCMATEVGSKKFAMKFLIGQLDIDHIKHKQKSIAQMTDE